MSTFDFIGDGLNRLKIGQEILEIIKLKRELQSIQKSQILYGFLTNEDCNQWYYLNELKKNLNAHQAYFKNLNHQV